MPEIWPVPEQFRPALASVPSDALDCLQTTFALFADQRHGPSAHVVLGSRLVFPMLGSLSRPNLNCGFDRRRVEARDLLGAHCRDILTPTIASELVQFARSAPCCYAIADAFDLGWLPTCGHEHAPHSFAVTLEGFDVVVVDAYTNATPWGDAQPGAWRLSPEEVTALVSSGVILREVDVTSGTAPAQAVSSELAAAAEGSVPLFATYVDDIVSRANRGESHVMVLDTWLLARDRRLHSMWLSSQGLGAGRQAVDQAWRDLSTRAYVVHRRAARTGEARFDVLATDLLERLHADVAELRRLRDRDGVERAVMSALAHVLGVDGAEIETAGDLRELPGFQSFRLVQVLDMVESQTGIAPSFADRRLDLFSVKGLAKLFAGEAADDAGP